MNNAAPVMMHLCAIQHRIDQASFRHSILGKTQARERETERYHPKLPAKSTDIDFYISSAASATRNVFVTLYQDLLFLV